MDENIGRKRLLVGDEYNGIFGWIEDSGVRLEFYKEGKLSVKGVLNYQGYFYGEEAQGGSCDRECRILKEVHKNTMESLMGAQ